MDNATTNSLILDILVGLPTFGGLALFGLAMWRQNNALIALLERLLDRCVEDWQEGHDALNKVVEEATKPRPHD